MKEPSYSERRWRPIRWWEIAIRKHACEMPFLHHYPEPPAVLIAQILAQARRLIVPAEQAASPAASDDPWQDGGLASAWFAGGDQGLPPSNQAEGGSDA